MLLILFFITIAISFVFSYSVEKLFVKYSIFLDIPTKRSSHDTPTPTAGGISILLSYLIYIFLLLSCSQIFIPEYDGNLEQVNQVFFILLLSLAPIIIIGLIDDFKKVNITLRIFVQLFSATIIIYCFYIRSENNIFDVNTYTQQASLMIILLSIVLSMWLMNLYNFMDGIDGYASIQCIFVSLSASIFAYINNPDNIMYLYIFGLGLASIGFLCRNIYPAKIFMGDTGSVSIGCIFAFFIFYSASESILSIYTWLILLSVFIVDSTYTLLVRIVTKKNIFKAHLTHAFHIVTRKNNSPITTNKILMCINIFWVFPLAALSNIYTHYNFIVTIIVYLPLLFSLINIGAGLEEEY
jgi:Fuc2NAc and GlcNAc transferase